MTAHCQPGRERYHPRGRRPVLWLVVAAAVAVPASACSSSNPGGTEAGHVGSPPAVLSSPAPTTASSAAAGLVVGEEVNGRRVNLGVGEALTLTLGSLVWSAPEVTGAGLEVITVTGAGTAHMQAHLRGVSPGVVSVDANGGQSCGTPTSSSSLATPLSSASCGPGRHFHLVVQVTPAGARP